MTTSYFGKQHFTALNNALSVLKSSVILRYL